MNFYQLYHHNRQAVIESLRSLWCVEAVNESQRAYAKRIGDLLPELFAPHDAVPLVQCMNLYQSVEKQQAAEARALVDGLWDKPTARPYDPYAHQFRCWEVLLKERTADDKPKSICVTTGTGSGKTECFMIPLVCDLVQRKKKQRAEAPEAKGQVQALFLYPLNALMEDQKERLEELLEGTDLTYAVYNGDLPEREPSSKDNTTEATKLRQHIRQIRGVEVDERTGEERVKYKHLLYTREQVRKERPDILLTNPTMLEYILLRKKDERLIDVKAKSLKWVAIDETHTYTGAGAAELAMLLRRVLLAFGVTAEDVHFATSSATFGNGSNPDKERAELTSFITGITGVRSDQVEVVGGQRVGANCLPDNEDHDRWKRLVKEEFVTLNSLFPNELTVDAQLQALDAMVERLGERKDMKVKVHYFYRVPNNGLYVRLDEVNADGTFKLYTENKFDTPTETPLVELSRCKNCGEYVAIVRRERESGKYHGLLPDDTDLFDLEMDVPSEQEESKVIALSKYELKKQQGNSVYTLIKDRKTGEKVLKPALPGEVNLEDWHLVANQHCKCPYCNCSLTRHKDSDNELDAQTAEEMSDAGTLMRFRLSAEFISRIIAPSVLDELDTHVDAGGKQLLHNGQQYISFADSRQLAATATLKQNQEQERMWFYTAIYHELCRRASMDKGAELAALQAQMTAAMATNNMSEMARVSKLMMNACNQDGGTPTMTWQEVFDLLFADPLCDRYCYEFVKRNGHSDELNDEGVITPKVKQQYVLSLMTMYLTSRPRSAAAPETMGLFTTCYNKLKGVMVPVPVKNKFNALLQHAENRITDEDWKNFLQVFMDYRVRSDQSVYLEMPNLTLDIFDTRRFAVESSHRKPVVKPELKRDTLTSSRMVRYLCALLRREYPQYETDKEVYRAFFDEISLVMDKLWEDLTVTTKLLQLGRYYDDISAQFVPDTKGGYRLNLADLSIKLFEDVYLVDTNSEHEDVTNRAERLRPIEMHFKNFSPYLRGGVAVELDESLRAQWKPYPYYKGSGQEQTFDELQEWAKKERANLWLKDRELWGKTGVFADRLNDIHLVPNFFIQVEHTAQVDKMISRQLQRDFKEHRINILACSTTMEMGVDLGTLQLVMMSSVPPQPANYKQRAGRSGRSATMVKSACMTLCGSDAIGLRTLKNPIDNVINRPVEVPRVDLMSPQVVQRHANSFLVRALGVFGDGNVNQQVINYYTTFHIEGRNGKKEVMDANNRTQDPLTMLGETKGTMYERFNEACHPEKIEGEVRKNLDLLLKGTVFEGCTDEVINKARAENERCYEELSNRMEDIRSAYAGCTGNTDSEKRFRTKQKMNYHEVLEHRLLNFWATHRFTPNANMPVNVLELDLSPLYRGRYGASKSSSNPSYTLRDAISQYAPGNSVTVDGVVYVVRGIEFSNQYQNSIAFKLLARNNEETVMGEKVELLEGRKPWWDGTKRYEIELVEPVAFIPDINEENTRIVEKKRYTHVSAQLLDATEWKNPSEEYLPLYSVRCNRDSGDAKILYYNEGIGYGYCLCTKCGRMVLETDVAEKPKTIVDLPQGFNVFLDKKQDKETGLMVNDTSKPRHHLAISGKKARLKCEGSNDENCIRRNVIIGGLLQTDFSEIKIRHLGHEWMHDRMTERNLLLTLGIVFTQALVEILGKERNAVDFTILPFGHLCIFDTNPGGAGYSNQLADEGMMDKVIRKSKELLTIAQLTKSKDFLLDKFTLRYIRNVDTQAALAWIAEQESL